MLAGAYAGRAGSLPQEEVEARLQRALREQHMAPKDWVPGYMPGMVTEAAPQMVQGQHPSCQRRLDVGMAFLSRPRVRSLQP